VENVRVDVGLNDVDDYKRDEKGDEKNPVASSTAPKPANGHPNVAIDASLHGLVLLPGWEIAKAGCPNEHHYADQERRASIICAMKIATLATMRINKNKVLITSASNAGSERAPLCTVKKHRDETALSSAG
jgi:hypothetical protein